MYARCVYVFLLVLLLHACEPLCLPCTSERQKEGSAARILIQHAGHTSEEKKGKGKNGVKFVARNEKRSFLFFFLLFDCLFHLPASYIPGERRRRKYCIQKEAAGDGER